MHSDGIYLFAGDRPSNDGGVIPQTTTTGIKKVYPVNGKMVAVQVWGGTTSGTGSAVVNIETSVLGGSPLTLTEQEGNVWSVMFQFMLTLGVPITYEGAASGEIAWKYIRGNVVSLSGTGAYLYGALSIK